MPRWPPYPQSSWSGVEPQRRQLHRRGRIRVTWSWSERDPAFGVAHARSSLSVSGRGLIAFRTAWNKLIQRAADVTAELFARLLFNRIAVMSTKMACRLGGLRVFEYIGFLGFRVYSGLSRMSVTFVVYQYPRPPVRWMPYRARGCQGLQSQREQSRLLPEGVAAVPICGWYPGAPRLHLIGRQRRLLGGLDKSVARASPRPL